MPKIAELRKIDGAMWARLPDLQPPARAQILSDAEITANAEKWEALLTENDRLRAEVEHLKRNMPRPDTPYL